MRETRELPLLAVRVNRRGEVNPRRKNAGAGEMPTLTPLGAREENLVRMLNPRLVFASRYLSAHTTRAALLREGEVAQEDPSLFVCPATHLLSGSLALRQRRAAK